MNELTQYLLLVIVVWRLTHLISAEDGPFDLIIQLRKRAGHSFAGKLMDCFYCLSIWIGLAAALYVTRHWPDTLLLCFYYSGAAILLEKITNKNFN